ncbi:MAG: trypsin-like serine protease, partial [Myxococcales bacterium]|nr:trypsin-like serine protease [Myxococcales bacterium]
MTILREGTHGTRWRAVGLGAFVLLGCAAEPLATRESGIVGGTPASDEAVVAIRYVDGELRCSGTVIAPRVVLTAGHCGIHAGNYYGFEVFFGPDTRGPGKRLAVVDAVRHPAFDGPSFGNDLALLFLAAEAPATPKPLRTGPLTPSDVAADVRIVGYGRTKADLDDAGVRRQGFARITEVTSSEAVLGGASQQCSYDSGGPTFTTEGGIEVLTGVTSRGDSACVEYARVVRVDA